MNGLLGKSHAIAAAAAALTLASPLASPLAAQDHSTHDEAADATLARVGSEFMVMEVSTNEAARAHFLRGLALLHNFEYGYAAGEFRRAQEADPGFVMAYWGEAMTHNHPLWEEQDFDAARAILARLGPTREARAAKARSAQEAQWLEAVETLYGAGTKEARDLAYLDRMRAMLARFPDDIDVRAFTGLAVLGSSHGGRQVPVYMEAAGLLEPGFMTHEMHPGILHYLIHSYDDPVHAPLGERMAERYAVVAPDAGHAQHMVSHIFHALADWEASEAANIKADAVVDRQLAARGRGPTFCGHYNEWLVYALVQQGKDAGAIVDGCRAQAISEIERGASGEGYRSASGGFSTIALYSGVTSGRWAEEVDWPEQGHLMARFNMAYADLLRSRGDADAAARALARAKRLNDEFTAALAASNPDERTIPTWNLRMIAQGEAIALLAAGNRAAGLDALRAAAEAESALPVVFGPPAIAKPSWELLGEELLAEGRREEAAEAFRRSLEFAPGRLLSLRGPEAAGSGG
jgi:tetratricopeptide (TPR) repeat protein